MMHRWHFQRLFRWFLPAFVFVVALCAVTARRTAAGVGLSFFDDCVYADFAVARNLIEKHVYALDPGQPAPAVRETLWRFAVALTTLVTGNEGAAAFILGAAFSLMTIFLCLRLSRLLFPFPPFIIYSAVLLIFAPSFLLTPVERPSLAMSTGLFVAACLFHVEDFLECRAPLSMRSALFVGLLAWLHLEYILLWFVFFAHAIILNRRHRSRSTSMALVATRGLTGMLFLALCVFPLVAWNVSVLQVPWPQAMGAPFVMDTWLSAGPSKAVRTYFSLVGEALPAAFSKLYAAPFLSGLSERMVVWFGALFITALAIWRPEERPYTLLLFLLFLMPAFYALIYPCLGWRAAAPLFNALTPLCVIAASFGIFRVPFLVENLYWRWKKGLPATSGFNVWWFLMGSSLLLTCLIRNISLLDRGNSLLVEQLEARTAVSNAMKSGAIPGQWIVTDQPGWLAYAHRARALDLTGEFTPPALACLDDQGHVDASELSAYLADEKPDSMILWLPKNEFVSSLVPCKPVARDVMRRIGEWPKIYVINYSGAF